MLSFRQFVAKHPVKYSGLSQQQKRQRYQDYVRSLSNNSKPAPSRPTRGLRRTGLRTRLIPNSSKALADYLKMVANPFVGDTVGIPAFPSPPSTKITAFSRGTFALGTAGFGFVAISPTAANDVNGVFYSVATYTGTTVTDNTGTTGVLANMLTNLPFAAASFVETNVRVRFACCAVRVRYIGKETDMSGIYLPFVHPMHSTVVGHTVDTIRSREEYSSCPMSREWCSAVLTPATRKELDYHHLTNLPIDHDDVTAQTAPVMCIVISGLASASYEFEVVNHIELVSATGSVSRTENNVSQTIEPLLTNLSSPAVTNRGYKLIDRVRGALASGARTATRVTARTVMDNLLRRAEARQNPNLFLEDE